MLWLIGKDDGEGYETKRQAFTAQYQQRSNFIGCLVLHCNQIQIVHICIKSD